VVHNWISRTCVSINSTAGRPSRWAFATHFSFFLVSFPHRNKSWQCPGCYSDCLVIWGWESAAPLPPGSLAYAGPHGRKGLFWMEESDGTDGCITPL